MPKNLQRCVYFLRPSSAAAPVIQHNFEHSVICGQLSGSMMGPLEALCSEVVPLLAHTSNFEQTLCLSDELISVLDTFKSSRSVEGLRNAVLMMPSINRSALKAAAAGESKLEAALLHKLESAIYTWATMAERTVRTTCLPDTVPAQREAGNASHSERLLSAWDTHAMAVKSIQTQLQQDDVATALQAMKHCDPSNASLRRIDAAIEEVQASGSISQQLGVVLQCIKPLLEQVGSASSLADMPNKIKLAFHGILLCWQHCPTGIRPDQLEQLTAAMALDVVAAAQQCVQGTDILRGDLVMAAHSARSILRTLGYFKSCYAEYRSMSHQRDLKRAWAPLTPKSLTYLDALMARCQDVHDVSTAFTTFANLEHIEFGGPRGAAMIIAARQLHEDFMAVHERLVSAVADPLNMLEEDYHHAVTLWRGAIKQLDSRLACLVHAAFKSSPTQQAEMSLVQSLQSLIDRPGVRMQTENACLEATKTCASELRRVHEEFEARRRPSSQTGGRLGDRSIAAAITWCRGLHDRIVQPMRRLEKGPLAVLQTSSGREVIRLYKSLSLALHAFESSILSDWCAACACTIEAALATPVLALSQTGLLQVNYDPRLARVLGEVRGLLAFTELPCDIPSCALDFYRRESLILTQLESLQEIVTVINEATNGTTAIELPLLESSLTHTRGLAVQGTQAFTWVTLELDNYISLAKKQAEILRVHMKSLRNVQGAIHAERQRWLETLPLGGSLFAIVQTDPQQDDTLHALRNSLQDALRSRKEVLNEGMSRIIGSVEAARQLLSPTEQNWSVFCCHVKSSICASLREAVGLSLDSVANLLTGSSLTDPALSIKVQSSNPSVGLWCQPRLRFGPETDVGKSLDSLEGVLQSFIKDLASLGNDASFARLQGLSLQASNHDSNDMMHTCLEASLNALDSSFKLAADGIEHLNKYEEFWLPDVWSVARFIGPSERNKDGDIKNATSLNTLEAVFAEVQRLKALRAEILGLPSFIKPSCGWLVLDIGSAQQSLAFVAAKRITSLTNTVKSQVESILHEQHEFIRMAFEKVSSRAHTLSVSSSTSKAASRRPSATTTVNAAATLNRRVSQLPRSRSPSVASSPSAQTTRGSISVQPRSSTSILSASRRSSSSQAALSPAERERLHETLRCLREIDEQASQAESMIQSLKGTSSLLQSMGTPLSEEILTQLSNAPEKWSSLLLHSSSQREDLRPAIAAESEAIKHRTRDLKTQIDGFCVLFRENAPFGLPPGHSRLDKFSLAAALDVLDVLTLVGKGEIKGLPAVSSLESLMEAVKVEQDHHSLLGMPFPSTSLMEPLQRCSEEAAHLRQLWDKGSDVLQHFATWSSLRWNGIDVDAITEKAKQKLRELRSLPKALHEYEVFRVQEDMIKGLTTVLPLLSDLAHPAMRERHWSLIGTSLGADLSSNMQSMTLGGLLNAGLDRCADTCVEVVDIAKKEALIEKSLEKIDALWQGLELTFAAGKSGVPLLEIDVALTAALESDGVTLQNMATSKVVTSDPAFKKQVLHWQGLLASVDSLLSMWTDTQRKWASLEAIFSGEGDIRTSLPTESAVFDGVDQQWKALMLQAPETPRVLAAIKVPGRQTLLETILSSLETSERALQDYLETKRRAFPRFYFVAPADLLDMLAHGGDPHAIEPHLSKLFDNVHRLEWKKDSATGAKTNIAVGMYSKEGEYVPFADECAHKGTLENWLARLVEAMKSALRSEYQRAMLAYEETPRPQFVFDFSAQTVSLVTRTAFTSEVEAALQEAEAVNDDALKAVAAQQRSQLADLIQLINGDLSPTDRKKLITLCTIDVHARDVVMRLVEERCDSVDAFTWQSQLRYGRDATTGDPLVSICDAQIPYQWEYIGNSGCLCITPLTDRCYITLTTAQRLILGGAPSGPAGTGKTETVKDLAKCLGMQCYVFNCSDQMDYRSLGQIFKGLAQTGAWGCFDEFNRITTPVLSVCSTQYKAILDALRGRQDTFTFPDGMQIPVHRNTMAFITMNPGYAGRSDLPESLKALFRPVSMAAPDLSLICENMLLAEGFQNARLLARKFVVLYRLCESLLSKSKHYDWKLRAIKTTLYVAGTLKRAAPELSEEKVLLRALRDFNLGKLTSDDAVVFNGLLDDLFPNTAASVPRAVDRTFESYVQQAAVELGYVPEPAFLLKVSQLREIFQVRWSVFLLGPPGAGKTAVWKTLQRALCLSGQPAIASVMNPKSMTRDELYGCIHPQTREWREGVLSAAFRQMALPDEDPSSAQHQWLVLDGDIDPEWIESMNTVMDDNKMLTLATNERIPLTSSMRLLFEISHMNHASPATVSRGGVIYINGKRGR
jgi:hypothetical protein